MAVGVPDAPAKLHTVYPILVGGQHREGEKGYPFSSNFFVNGSNEFLRRLPEAVT